MAKRRKVQLPRVTILAYSKRELAAFTMAVESLRGIAEEIRIETALLREELAAAKRRKRTAKPDNAIPKETSPS